MEARAGTFMKDASASWLGSVAFFFKNVEFEEHVDGFVKMGYWRKQT
jgi:hypothetical protein